MKLSNIPIFLLIAIIVFISPEAFADSSGASNNAKDVINEILNYGVKTDPTNDDVEYFQIWLTYIFGTFIFDAETGSQGTVSVLSQALGFVNLIALCFGFVMVSYVFAGGALNSAHSGEVLGKNWSTIWMPIRTSLGLGFIMPAPAFGAGVLSFAQVAVIWLVIFGSNAGSYLWRSSVKSMVTYGVYGDVRTPSSKGAVSDLSKIMVCLDHRAKNADKDALDGGFLGATVYYKEKNNYQVDTNVVNVAASYTSTNTTTITNYRHKELIEEIKFPLVDSEASTYSHRISNIENLTKFIAKDKIFPSKIVFDSCGSIDGIKTLQDGAVTQTKNANIATIYGPRKASDTSAEEYNDQLEKVYKKYHTDYLNKALTAAWSAASEVGGVLNGHPGKAANLVRANSQNSSQTDEVKTKLEAVAKNIVTATNEYEKSYSDLKSMHIDKSKSLHQADLSEFGRGGWAGAGVWFIKIGQLDRKVASSSYHATVDPSITSVICDPDTADSMIKALFKECEKANVNYKGSLTLIDHSINATIGKSTAISIPTKVNNYNADGGTDLANLCTADGCDISSGTPDSLGRSFAQNILNALTIVPIGKADPNSTSVNGGFFSATGLQNPFNTLQTIGNNLNNLAMAAFFGWAAVTIVAYTVKGASDSAAGFFGANAIGESVARGSDVIFITLLPLLVSTFTSGFVLAYLIPFLPVLAWINMMVGYLITVIEAVTAAPLAVVQLLTPEGQGILGSRLERAMQLLVVIMLKPTLMVIGLLSSIVVSSIAFSIFNEFFWQASVLNLGDVGIIDAIAMIVIYTTSALTLTKLVVGVMYNLPDHILEWFAGGTARKFGEEGTGDSLKSSTTAMSGAIQGMGNGLKSRIQHNKSMSLNRNREDGDQARHKQLMTALGHGDMVKDQENKT